MPLNLSIIIPTLGYRSLFDEVLDAVKTVKPAEIVVIAPKHDYVLASLEVKELINFQVGPKGRGAALAYGAEVASQEWLLFVHDDTVLAANAHDEIKRFISDPNHINKAGYFIFKQDEDHIKSWLLEKLVMLRNIFLALPYGDQGLLIHKNLYHQLGGFRIDYPMMEDVDFICKLGRKRLVRLNAQAVTSAVRYRNSYLKRIARNARCLFLYFSGKDPIEIAKIYEQVV